MPKRREGSRRDKKTGFYYFYEYVGLGHSQIETTMRYLHDDFGRMKKAMEALERKTKKKD
jgi:hypothetical protein